MDKLHLDKATANIHWITEKAREFQINIYLCFINYAKAFDLRIMTNCGKLFKRWEYQTILAVSWETCMRFKKQQLEPCMEQLVSSRLKSTTGLSAVTLSV